MPFKQGAITMITYEETIEMKGTRSRGGKKFYKTIPIKT